MSDLLKVFVFLFASLQALQAQNFVLRQDIPVRENGELLNFPWTGGITAPQINKMDIDLDGTEDLILFDRLSDKILTFLATDQGYSYSPEFNGIFPEGLQSWVLLRDFNGDGLKDIFTSTSLGMEVYVNTTKDNSISWRLFHARRPGPSPLLTQGFTSAINLQLNASDKPSISDVDGDGDLDILVFRFAGGSTVEYHRNFSMERSGAADSLQMERVTSIWGDFRECFCGTFAFDGEDCALPPGRPMHEGGKTLTIVDLDNDGLPEAMVSEETCDALFYLNNQGSVETAHMTEVIDYLPGQTYPFFPAAYLEDVNNDGLGDMILASNWPSAQENRAEVLPLLLNNGTVSVPDFEQVTETFLLDEMIDAGGMSHPTFFDVNGDGLQDLIVGHYADGDTGNPSSGLWLYENTGTLGAPEFELTNKDYARLKQYFIYAMRPEFLDVNGDGIEDLVLTALDREGENSVMFVPNSGGQSAIFDTEPQELFSGLGPQDVVSFALINEDNIPDLLWGRSSGRVDLYTGRRTDGFLGFEFESEAVFDLGNDNFRGPTFIRVTDVDGDGAADLLRADRLGNSAWLSDFGNNTSFDWLPVNLLVAEDSDTVRPGRNIAPAVVNLFNTTRAQLVLGSAGGGLQFFVQANDSQPPVSERIVLYPNPVSQDYFRIMASGEVTGVIVDATGRTLTNEMQIVPGQRIFIGGLANGMYFLRISGIRRTIPFVVLR